MPCGHPVAVGVAGRIARARAAAARSKTIAADSLALFKHAVINHHVEEESELFIAVLRSAQPGEEHNLVQMLVSQLTREHRSIEALWKRLEPAISATAKGKDADVDNCCSYCSWACPYGAREMDAERKVMTKCTLCVDRIYDELLPPQDRKPACVKACPTGARLFGDIKDANSEVSKAIKERGGYQLMPEWETQPANHYLPRAVVSVSDRKVSMNVETGRLQIPAGEA